MTTTPFAATRLAKFVAKRIEELHSKTQADIAREAGFKNANFITMIKTGSAKLPLDRVQDFAKALDTDPRSLMHLAIEQTYGPKMLAVLVELLGEPLTENERAWIDLVRTASNETDPLPSTTARKVLHALLDDRA